MHLRLGLCLCLCLCDAGGGVGVCRLVLLLVGSDLTGVSLGCGWQVCLLVVVGIVFGATKCFGLC